MGYTLLREWGLRATIDFGHIVFTSSNTEVFAKNETDAIEDFMEVYSFQEAFKNPFSRAVNRRFNQRNKTPLKKKTRPPHLKTPTPDPPAPTVVRFFLNDTPPPRLLRFHPQPSRATSPPPPPPVGFWKTSSPASSTLKTVHAASRLRAVWVKTGSIHEGALSRLGPFPITSNTCSSRATGSYGPVSIA